jgi:hypothetical protein
MGRAVVHGRLAERGDHAALLPRGGLYAELYERQFRMQAGEPEVAALRRAWAVVSVAFPTNSDAR